MILATANTTGIIMDTVTRAAMAAGCSDYGELRLLVLAMISEQPRHGYELTGRSRERQAAVTPPAPV